MADVVDINAPGWEGLDAQAPEAPQYSATDQANIDKLISKMFDTYEGQQVMTWLSSAYLQQPTWAPGYSTDWGFFREGQNTLIRELQTRIKRAKEN